MRNILIVDDDQLIRDGLCLILKSIAVHETLLTACNGAQALEKIFEVPVDLIFADIKMPTLGGLELMGKLQEMKYSGEVVIISGFDEFEFARRAMKLGAADYLLKPVKAEELQAVYEECKRRMALKGGLKEWTASPSLPVENQYLQQAWLTKLLTCGEAAMDVFSGLPSLSSSIIAVVTDPFINGHANMFNIQTSIELGHTLVSYLAQDGQLAMIQGEFHQDWVMLFFSSEENAFSDMACLTRVLQKKHIRYGMSQHPFTIHKCLDAYFQALACLEQCFYDLPENTVTQAEAFPYPEATQRVIDEVISGNIPKSGEAVLMLFDQILLNRPSVETLRQHLASIIYTLMNKNKEFIGIIGKYKFTDHDIILKLRETSVFSQLKQNYWNTLCLYLDDLRDRHISKDDYAIQKAKAYIDQTYQNNVSLMEISEKLGLHPNYLSSLFHHKTGETFSDYLRSVRICKAIHLMKSTNLKVYEIAMQVGYSDSAQFFRAFKQMTGISPGKYKQKHT